MNKIDGLKTLKSLKGVSLWWSFIALSALATLILMAEFYQLEKARNVAVSAVKGIETSVLSAPVIVNNVACVRGSYGSKEMTISWPQITKPVSYVDISPNENFIPLYHKRVFGTNTTAPAQFTLSGGGGFLTGQPNKTYYVRLYNGTHSPVATFSIPACATPTPTAQPTTISPTISPKVKASITPTIASISAAPLTVTPTSTPALPCLISAASWGVEKAAEGDKVSLKVSGNGGCEGKGVAFKVYKYNRLFFGLGSSEIVPDPLPGVFSNAQAVSSWTAKYQSEGILDFLGLPEYYFEAQIVGDTRTVNSSDPHLKVSSATNPTILSAPKITTTSSGANISWETDNDALSAAEYGLTDSYGSSIAGSSNGLQTKNHAVTINNLNPCTTYRFRIKLTDQNNSGEVISTGSTFTTKGCTGEATIISQISSNILSNLGGEVSLINSDAKGIKLDIPASAFATGSAQFQIKQIDPGALESAAPLPAGKKIVSKYAYNLVALSDVSSVVSTFYKTLTITISYSPADIAGFDESTFRIYRYDGSVWSRLSGCTLNSSAQTISCGTSNFSDFALVGDPIIVSPTPTIIASPSATLTPIPIESEPTPPIIASPSATLTPAASVSATPVPIESGPTAPCLLEKANWVFSSSEVNVKEGTEVPLEVTATGECKGKVVQFKVIKNGGFLVSEEAAKNNPAIAHFTGNKARSIWKTEFKSSGIFDLFSPPQYYFQATVIDEGTSDDVKQATTVTSSGPLLGVTAASGPAVTATDWPQLQYDSQHKGRTQVSVDPDYEVAWAWMDKNHIVKNFVSATNKSLTDGFEPGFKVSVTFSSQVQPIIANNMSYFGALNGVMYAVDATTGDNKWDFTSAGPILGTAAYDQGILIFGSMDGKVYGLDGVTGGKIWEYPTGTGINAAPVIAGGVVYVGSRDGKFYALDVLTGALKWSYTTRIEPADPNSPFNKAPIVAPAAISEDGSSVFFGAENMFFYALNTSNGSEKWAPKKVIGQSFLYSWPVVNGDKVIINTMNSLGGSEWEMEAVLDGLSANPTWTEEKAATLNWLNQNPHEKTMHVFDVNTGVEPYQVAMGKVYGNNYPPFPPVIDNSGRLLTYWRSKVATFFTNPGSFGSKYCPDMSAMDMTTGDRIKITNPTPMWCPEIDNGFQFSVGGNNLYFANDFRGSFYANLLTGNNRRMTAPIAKWDGANFRVWGAQIVYYGNDNELTDAPTTDPRPQVEGGVFGHLGNAIGFAGVAAASVNGQNMLYVNEGRAYAIVAIRKKP